MTFVKKPVSALACHLLLAFLGLFCLTSLPAQAQSSKPIRLTLDSAINLAMDNSYRVQQLQLGVQESKSWLRAERAGLKSRVYMNLSTPELEVISDNKWNSELRQYEIVRENTRLWQADIAIRQPVVLFGYPTNGYLSLNNRVYRYTQLSEGESVRYYNRYFIKYEQPFFQPNQLKNNIREAELNLQEEELDYRRDLVDMIGDIANDYYDLFELAYERRIYSNLVGNLEKAKSLAQQIAREDSSRSIEVSQLQVELGNAREQLSQAKSDFRLQASQIKQRLRLNENDSLQVTPTTTITQVDINEQEAIKYGRTLRPRLRDLEIQREQRELNLKETEGWNSFRLNLEATYGREMQDPRFRELWGEPTNSYTVGLNAYIPLWDWGQHDAQVQARQLSLERTKLRIEEAQSDIKSDIANAVRNLEEYQQRALNMEDNLEIARRVADTNLRRYANGEIAALDLIQSIKGQQETAMNFLNAYLGYRQALLSLQENTYYDFEKGLPLLERFQVSGI